MSATDASKMTLTAHNGASVKDVKAAADGDVEEEDDPGGSFTKPACRIPWRGCLALLGGFLIQLTLGSFYSFGNMMTYMTSYMR
jgi:hypothetical protein